MLNPGLHTDIPARDYHADPCSQPSLSSGLAKLFINETPQHVFRAHPKLNPDYRDQEASAQMERGTIIHSLLLGKGEEIAVLEYDDFRKKEAQEARDKARAAGKIPVLAKHYSEYEEIPDAVHPILFSMGIDLRETTNEAVAIWEEDGAYCRLMTDALDTSGIIYDVKTHAGSMSDKALARTIANYLYDFQAAFYVRGIEKTFPAMAGRLKFRWIFVSPEAPYDVRVVEATQAQLDMAGRVVDRAITQWKACTKANSWPGYPHEITTVEMPAWYENAIIEMEMND